MNDADLIHSHSLVTSQTKTLLAYHSWLFIPQPDLKKHFRYITGYIVTFYTRNLTAANRSRVRCTHNTSRTPILTRYFLLLLQETTPLQYIEPAIESCSSFTGSSRDRENYVRGHSRSLEVAAFDRSHIEFLSAFDSSYGATYRLRDIASYWSKCLYPTCI